MIKVSVIVPVYNKSRYLAACLDSLINQTLSDIEIICIDDKSTDNSLDILFEYERNDKRVKVLSLPKNSGVSNARNMGMRMAQGEYIAFVDADDFVDTDFYEKLYLGSNGLECVKGEIWDYDSEINNCTLNATYNLNSKIKESENPIYFFYGFTSAIYRREFINKYGFHFPEGCSYFEDPYFSMTLASRLSSIKIVDNARYYYRTVSDSLSKGITPKKIDELCRSLRKILAYLNKTNYSLENKFLVVNQLFSTTSTLSVEGRMNIDQIRRIRRDYISFLNLKGIGTVDNIKVSIILPVFNGERWLRRTLDCLTMQSLTDIEIICVNDKSTDNSLDILKEYQNEDKRIRIIDCDENGGESKARNIGIQAAKGEYIAFMDQDDRIDLSFYQVVYSNAIEAGTDIVKGDAIDYGYDGKEFVAPRGLISTNPLYFSSCWWSAIYNRAFILKNRIELPEGRPLGGDLKFLFDACMACNKVAMSHGPAYHHITHPDSGDAFRTSLVKIKSVIEILTYILGKIEKNGIYEKDVDCYIFYYLSYINHLYVRTQSCEDLEGKLLCVKTIFSFFNSCKCKERVIDKLKINTPFLSSLLENNQQDFLADCIENDTLSETFYSKANDNIRTRSVPCQIIVPYIDAALVDKYITNNSFLKRETNTSYCLIDNKLLNKPISRIYNEFLDKYDYSNNEWLVFMHSDFEFLTFPSNLLNQLDKSVIYGPTGYKTYFSQGKMFVKRKSNVYEKHLNQFNENYVDILDNASVDTVDCMCLILHSSLVNKYNLRFDENATFDLYVEDFCISAQKKYGIPIEVVSFDCAHHSSYFTQRYYSKRYLAQLEYLNNKYPDEIYGGTVTPIGGKLLPSMSDREFYTYMIRKKLLLKEKK